MEILGCLSLTRRWTASLFVEQLLVVDGESMPVAWDAAKRKQANQSNSLRSAKPADCMSRAKNRRPWCVERFA